MVHRAPDSRLLTNLIHHEKEHAKHLAALFPLSHATLASLSAYAAASPQHTIAVVVDVLASADDAFQRYAHALDIWRGQLVALKDLEDDLSAVLRDRDILVTRLIKASKSTRDANRSSRLVPPLTNFGSASFSSLPSTGSSTAFSSGGSSPASINIKLAQAQAELQACEAHLVSKERELDARRITLARDDLGARCRALIDCGWIWGELGKQGLKALQALSVDASGNGHAAPKQLLAVPPSMNANPTTYASDNSSLTPSQSASQIVARSTETSLEGPASKEYERAQSEKERASVPKLGSRSTTANEGEDLTITLPPAHAISDSALPTGVRVQPRSIENGDLTAATNTGPSAQSQPAAGQRRKRTKRPLRPPSQHIAEVSDEGPDEPPLTSPNANTSPKVPPTPFPTARALEAQDTSSEEGPTGPLQVVDNDPFEVIRRSMLGPSAAAPTAHASAPDVRVSAVGETSPSKIGLPGSASASGHGGIGSGSSPGAVSSPGKRQRRPSMAFFGSLRGLFRKPKEREHASIAWDESPSHSPPSPSRRTRTSGWVTRTDARIRARGSGGDSEDEVTPQRSRKAAYVPNVVNMGRSTSGARLRKGRPGASVRENGSLRVDGWITDTQAGPGSSTDARTHAGGAAARSRTHRGTMKRKRTVADLRGSDQGHTDGEVDGGHQLLSHTPNKGTNLAPEPTPSMPIFEIEVGRQLVASRQASPTMASNRKATADPDSSLGTQHRRAATTTATSSRQPSSAAPPAHRRSASLSLMDAQVTILSRSASSQTSQSMSWRKPPPQIELPSQPTPPPQVASPQIHESQSKQGARRHIGNGHAKHAHNQSLMSLVADVARQNVNPNLDQTRSLDIPRAPGSVLRERDREVEDAERGVGTNAREHARMASAPEDGGHVTQVQSQRAIKMPLKSALRNASRTPSPSPGPATVIVTAREVKKEEDCEEVVPLALRDSASISSYETVKETMDMEELGVGPLLSSASPLRSPLHSPVPQSQLPDANARSRTPSPLPTLSFTFPPPPVDPPPVRSGTTTTSNPVPPANEPPSSNVSSETPGAQRRKSVRVSLQPTFSPAPPVLHDEDDEDTPRDGEARTGRKRERGGNRAKGGKRQGDVWADSSEEDETYSRARRLLSLVGRGKT